MVQFHVTRTTKGHSSNDTYHIMNVPERLSDTPHLALTSKTEISAKKAHEKTVHTPVPVIHPVASMVAPVKTSMTAPVASMVAPMAPVTPVIAPIKVPIVSTQEVVNRRAALERRLDTAKEAVKKETNAFMKASQISNKALGRLANDYDNPSMLEEYAAANTISRSAGERKAAAIKERNAVEKEMEQGLVSGGRMKRRRTRRKRTRRRHTKRHRKA